MTVTLPGKGKKDIDMMLTDSWLDLKIQVCDEFGVDADQYELEYRSPLPDTYLVRGKPMPNLVGKFNVWNGNLVLKRKGSSSSSSSSSS